MCDVIQLFCSAVMSPSLTLGHFVNENQRQCCQDEYVYFTVCYAAGTR